MLGRTGTPNFGRSLGGAALGGSAVFCLFGKIFLVAKKLFEGFEALGVILVVAEMTVVLLTVPWAGFFSLSVITVVEPIVSLTLLEGETGGERMEERGGGLVP